MLPSPFRRNRVRHTAAEFRQYSLSKRIYDIVRQNTNEFCTNTSLHGVKYVTDKQLYPRERIFFAISIVIALLLSGYFILHVFESWITNPLIVGINPRPVFITSEPFPAVTICNSNQASRIKMKKFSPHSVEYTLLQMLCKQDVNTSVSESLTNWNNLTRFIIDVSNSCEEMLQSCRYGGVNFNCSQVFRTIVTDEGLCCAFNTLHPKFMFHKGGYDISYPTGYEAVDWSTESGFGRHSSEKYIPMSSLGSGDSVGLRLVLNVQSEHFLCSYYNYVGFKILIHTPNETPNMRESSLLVSPGTSTKIRIHSDKMETDHSVRSIDKRARHCLFQDEVHLLHFSHYTRRNCEMECEALISLRTCGCISYFLPRIPEDAPTCSFYNTSCAARVHLRAMLANVEDGCQYCLPSCFDMTYQPDFFSNDLRKLSNMTGVLSMLAENASEEHAYVSIYFMERSYWSKKQTEYIGVTDVLSSIGGLMSLCIGFSFISLMECCFYGIIRCSRSVYQETCATMGKTPPIIKAGNLKRNFDHFGAGHIWLVGRRGFKQQQQQQLNRQLNIRSVLKKRKEEEYFKTIPIRRNVW